MFGLFSLNTLKFDILRQYTESTFFEKYESLITFLLYWDRRTRKLRTCITPDGSRLTMGKEAKSFYRNISTPLGVVLHENWHCICLSILQYKSNVRQPKSLRRILHATQPYTDYKQEATLQYSFEGIKLVILDLL